MPANPLAAEMSAAGSPGSTFRIANMDCASEESEIRGALDGFSDIRRLGFQLAERTLAIDAPESQMPAILKAIRDAGFDPQPVVIGDAKQTEEHGFTGGVPRLVVALVFAFAAEAFSFFAPEALSWKVAGMAVALVAIWLAGFDTYKKGFAALMAGKLTITTLMTVAVTGAFLIGQWPEAAMVMALYAIAEMIEAKAVDRARNAIKGLLALAPETAEVRQSDNSWVVRSARAVALGDLVRIKPGERVALDGIVVEGQSAINQAPVTGESIPVEKAPGDPVFAGTINETGSLVFRVTAAANNTTLARIIYAVEAAQGSRAPTQRFVDRFAAVYTPAVFIIALAVALVTPFALDWSWMQSIYKALVLLVIACPCALVISTPVTVVSGLSAAARRGILIKGGIYLESARKLRAVAIDKTGTITEGKPKLIAWEPLALNVDSAQIEAIAFALASRSDHPVSKAIAGGLKKNSNDVVDFKALLGRGVQGNVDGTQYVLGNQRLMTERNQMSAGLTATLLQFEESGKTATLLASQDAVLGVFAVADTIKATSKDAVLELRALGVTPVMLTGDNAITAKAIAHDAGIDDARGNLLPEHKFDAVKAMQSQYGATGMVGDGINDAPALAQADIGFAMGAAGTDTAMEAADVVVMNDDLHRVATTIRLSRKTYAVLWQNITLSLGIKLVFFGLALFGSATMWMAVFADVGASLLVVANGLRLLRTKV